MRSFCLILMALAGCTRSVQLSPAASVADAPPSGEKAFAKACTGCHLRPKVGQPSLKVSEMNPTLAGKGLAVVTRRSMPPKADSLTAENRRLIIEYLCDKALYSEEECAELAQTTPDSKRLVWTASTYLQAARNEVPLQGTPEPIDGPFHSQLLKHSRKSRTEQKLDTSYVVFGLGAAIERCDLIIKSKAGSPMTYEECLEKHLRLLTSYSSPNPAVGANP